MTGLRTFRLKTEPFLRLLFSLVNRFFSSKTKKRIHLAIDAIYTSWLYSEFKSMGRGVVLHRPLEVIGLRNITIGEMTVFGSHSIITAWDKYGEQDLTPSLVVGSNCDFGEYNHITCCNGIAIGNNVLTGRWVTICDNSHGDSSLECMKIPPAERIISSRGKIVIGDNVWIGDKATVLAGVHIGEGVVIGANSVVTHDIPPYCVAVGNPATVIKKNK